jgi:hypothetical protein
MINAVIDFMMGLITRAADRAAFFFLGKGYEKARNRKKENKILRDNIGKSDDALAERLRSRAANKDRNKR